MARPPSTEWTSSAATTGYVAALVTIVTTLRPSWEAEAEAVAPPRIGVEPPLIDLAVVAGHP